jgi:hypothetical protein
MKLPKRCVVPKKERDPLSWLNRDIKKVNPSIVPEVERTFIKHERGLAESVSGKQVVGSGNKNDKSDVKTDKFRYEAKSTDKRSLILKLDWLEKIVNEALRTGRKPAISIMFSEAADPCGKRWVMIEEDLFKELTGEGNV